MCEIATDTILALIKAAAIQRLGRSFTFHPIPMGEGWARFGVGIVSNQGITTEQMVKTLTDSLAVNVIDRKTNEVAQIEVTESETFDGTGCPLSPSFS